ncbi:MAG: hypothetical protein ACK40X_08785 [Armatimonadota bacterium]
MKQQWQQMTTQQKQIAIVLAVVIVLAVILIAWQLIPKQRPSTTTEVAQQPISPTIGSPTHGATTPAKGMPGSVPEEDPEKGMMMGQAGAPVTMGVGPTPAGPMMGAPSAPEVGAPTPPPPGKLESPPRPGRSDPFADLPSRKVEPFTPIVLPPTPEPVVIARAQRGSIGTETFGLSGIETNIPPLQAQRVDLRSYFAPPQPITTGPRELPGWRLAGTILTEGSVGAIIQTPDGRSQAVRLGSRITFGSSDYTVTQVDDQKVVLKDSKGEEYTLSRRPAGVTRPAMPSGYIMPGGYYGPGGFGQFGPGGFGQFGPGGFGQFGPSGWGPGGY